MKMTPEKLPKRRYAVFVECDEGGEYCYEDEYNKCVQSFLQREQAIAKRLKDIKYRISVVEMCVEIDKLVGELEYK